MAAAPTPEDQRCPCTSERKQGARRAEGPPAATQCGRHGAATRKVARWRCWGTPVELSAATAPSKGQRRLRTERAKGLARSGAAATRCAPEACWRAPAGVRAGRLTFGCVYWRAKRAGSSLPKNPVNLGLGRPNTAPPPCQNTPLENSTTNDVLIWEALYTHFMTNIMLFVPCSALRRPPDRAIGVIPGGTRRGNGTLFHFLASMHVCCMRLVRE